MKTVKMTRRARMQARESAALAPLICLLLSSACAPDGDAFDQDDPPLSESRQAITAEIPGQVDIVGKIMRNLPAQTLIASYATGRATSALTCSGTMIGPNILMTAAHCGITPARFAFFSYWVPNSSTVRIEEFNCGTLLLNSWPETDLALWYCQPNAAGEHPGVKYGYLDFDVIYSTTNFSSQRLPQLNSSATQNLLSVGKNVFSVWNNPVTSLGLGSEMLFSPGTIQSITTSVWSNPTPVNASDANLGQCGSGADDLAVGVNVNMISEGGCSGSAVISTNGKIIAGPISTAVPGSRQTQSIFTALTRTVIQTPNSFACPPLGATNMINGAFLSASYGLNAAGYRGTLDTDSDGLFDLQQDIEWRDGERPRALYYSSFNSQRSNAMWSWWASAGGFDTGNGTMRLENDISGWGRHVSGDRLGVQANSNVHVSFNISSDRPIAVCPLSASAPGASCVLWGSTGGTTLYGANLNVGSPPGLAFWTFGTGTTVIRDLAIVHNNNNSGLFDFDTADQRAIWARLNGTTEGPAAIVPLGTGSATGADWAAVLNLGDPSLFSQHTSLSWGNNKICFNLKANPMKPGSSSPVTIRVTEPLTATTSRTALEASFTATSAWVNRCTADFSLTGSSVGRVQFNATGTQGVLIDDVRITH